MNLIEYAHDIPSASIECMHAFLQAYCYDLVMDSSNLVLLSSLYVFKGVGRACGWG